MNWDLPPMDSFRVLSQIDKVDPDSWQRTLDELIALLEMEDLLKKPVRNLTLGERINCKLVGSSWLFRLGLRRYSSASS